MGTFSVDVRTQCLHGDSIDEDIDNVICIIVISDSFTLRL